MGRELTKEQCNGLQPCTTCVSRNNTCTYTSLSADIPRAKANYHRESLSHASHQPVNRLQTQRNAFAPHPNDRMPEDFEDFSTRRMSSTQDRGTAASDTNASSAGSMVGNLVPRPRDQTYQGAAGDQFERVPSTNIIGGSPELPVNTGVGNHDGYGATTGTGHGSHGGQKQAEDVDGNGNRKVIGRGHSEGNEGERLKAQSRLLNDGKGRLCKWAFPSKTP